MIIEDIGKDGTNMLLGKSNMFNCVYLEVFDENESNLIHLGKAEVQRLIIELEKLKKEIR